MSTQKSPWRLTENGTIRNVDGQSVAKVQLHHNVDWQENGRLIAAAPELLEALQAGIECGMIPSSSAKEGGAVRFSRQVHVADQIRAAIAKATGGDV